ncbi:hypothetical protein [Pseudobacteriovorax antillogorgiicola]|uniref:Uncharacterized protein n=1 Tax=Pseudobacteriovorax antillogorgiicola TaxID=1513793 RepID=A0A1Y6BXD5_9BACT|nr:hypothetical protein [Pseudobacteriovorax antillogorgiicola]TCS50285.1 hypothetical protein EDD56_113103 [Pseudobacteriovorax antillogorgiicola]SMF33855.1 hypothetical protein SAMN06296036_110102 [Pseudobacteriovorax antillogorgiicola]
MYWKVYHVDTGKIVKAGFESEDDAKDWLEAREDDFEDIYEIEEMDQDEEDEWLEAQEKEDYDDDEEDEIEPKESVGFGDDYYDGADLADDEEMSTVFEDDDL